MTDLTNPQELEKEPEPNIGHYIFNREKDKKSECNCKNDEVCNATSD